MSGLQKASIVIAAITTVYSIVSSAIDKHNQKLEEARQKSLEAANASEEEAKNLQDSYIKYQQLASIQNRTESQENQFKTALEEVTAALGDKQKALEGVTEETAEYNKELERTTKNEFKKAWGDAKEGLTTAEEKIKSIDINGNNRWLLNNSLDNSSKYIFRKDILSSLFSWNETEENKKAISIIEEKLKRYKYELEEGFLITRFSFLRSLKIVIYLLVL